MGRHEAFGSWLVGAVEATLRQMELLLSIGVLGLMCVVARDVLNRLGRLERAFEGRRRHQPRS